MVTSPAKGTAKFLIPAQIYKMVIPEMQRDKSYNYTAIKMNTYHKTDLIKSEFKHLNHTAMIINK